MIIVKKILTKFNFSNKDDTRRIKYIVIHYFGALGTAKSVANYFADAYRGASAHYSLDDGTIVYQSVEDGDIAWHCGTSGTYYHPFCRNSNSLGIEVRPYKIDKTSLDSGDNDWYFNDATIINLVNFVKSLMKKYNIDANHVIRHYDVTHKYCPRPYMGADINSVYNVSGNAMWAKFKAQLTSLVPEQATYYFDGTDWVQVKEDDMNAEQDKRLKAVEKAVFDLQKDVDLSQRATSMRESILIALAVGDLDTADELDADAKAQGFVTGYRHPRDGEMKL